MASLSNINGLFDVHSTGAILFSTSHGTSGQILKSNGNAAPTWVDASTVIGGPYLPLSGGTLTGNLAINGSNSLSVGGALTGTTATFSGNVGINTTNLSNRLNIKGAGGNWNTSAAIKLWDSTYSYGWYVGTANNQTAGDFYIRSVATEGAYPVTADQQFTIQQSGNVGIGTINPDTKLEVNGNIKLSSTAGQTATPSYIWLGNDYSNGTTRNKLKIYLYNSGTEQYGFTVGNASNIQYHSNQKHEFYVANSPKLNIIANGNVGIGTTTPDTQLHIYNSDSNWGAYSVITLGTDVEGTNQAQLKYYRGASASTESFQLSVRGTTALTALYNGNVGIGTASPQSLLSLGNTVDAQKLLLYDDNNNFKYGFGIQSNELRQFFPNSATSRMVFGTISDSDGSTFSERMRIDSSGNVGIGTDSPRPVGSGYTGVEIGNVSSGSSLWLSGFGDTTKGYLAMDTGGLNLTAISNHSLTFGTNNSPKMTILSGGNVGIGTTLPYGKLELSGSGNNWSTAPTIRLWDTTNAKGWLVGNVYNYATGDFYIRTLPSLSGNPGASQQEFTIKHATGNVGIGTTTPTSKLHLRDPGANSDVGIKIGNDSRDWNLKVMGSVSDSLQFFTHDNSNVMTINSTGQVGFGTSSIFGYGVSSTLTNVQISNGNYAVLTHQTTNSAANSGVWRNIVRYNGVYQIQAMNDVGTGEVTAFEINRSGTSITKVLFPNGNVGIGVTGPTEKLEIGGKVKINNANAPNNFAQLNIGWSGSGETRAIDIDGNWSANENKSISFTHGTASSNLVGQINCQHNSPGSRLRWGRLYHSGDSSAYTMELISSSQTTANLTVAGNITAAADVVAYSDERLKSNIKTLDGSKVLKMRGVSFDKDGKKGSGVIAQELEKVAPELVNNDSEYKGVAYGNLVGYLIEAIKELEARVKELENK